MTFENPWELLAEEECFPFESFDILHMLNKNWTMKIIKVNPTTLNV